MPVKVEDVVLYTCQGHTHNAIVLGINNGQVDHLGANGEPLLHLLFIAPERESEVSRTKIGYFPSSFIEYDVVHVSQEFSEQYKKNNGLASPAQIVSARGQGEWREVSVLVHQDEVSIPAPGAESIKHVIQSAVRILKGSKAK